MNIFDRNSPKSESLSKYSDIDLVNLTLDKDKNNFTEIVLRYQRQIFAYLLRLLNYHREDAEDVLAVTFLKAYQNLASFNTSMKFSSWLYRIAHNEAVNQIKKNVKHYTVNIENVEFPVEFDSKSVNLIDLEKVLNKLNVEDRNILILSYIEEKNYQEISDILKISVNNVAVRLNRAKKKAKSFNPKSIIL